MQLAALGTKMTQPPSAQKSRMEMYGPHTGVFPPDPSTERTLWYKELCAALEIPPLSELAHVAVPYMVTTIGRNVDEPASEKREMRARKRAQARRLKLAYLGLGPEPPGEMPKTGVTLYWSPELAFKKEVCGSLTAAETARGQELGRQTSAMLKKRAKDKRKKLLTKFVAVAGIAIGAAFLGPKIAAAFKGAGAASTAGGAGASAAKGATVAAKVKTATTAAKVAKTAGVVSKVKTGSTIATGAKALIKGGATASTPAQIAAKEASKKAVTKKAVAVAGASLADNAAAVVPKVIKGVNTARTIHAIANGEVPPPPISLEGDNFTEYGISIAKQLAQKELGDKAREISEAEYANAMREMQARASRYVPPNTSMYPSQYVAPPVVNSMVREKQTNETLHAGLMFAIPLALAVLLKG